MEVNFPTAVIVPPSESIKPNFFPFSLYRQINILLSIFMKSLAECLLCEKELVIAFDKQRCVESLCQNAVSLF